MRRSPPPSPTSVLPSRAPAMAEALLALGGNLGEVRATLAGAIAMLCERSNIRLLARSSDYLTPPWGVEDQPPFVNLCIAVAPARIIAGVRVDEALKRVDNTGIKKLPPP